MSPADLSPGADRGDDGRDARLADLIRGLLDARRRGTPPDLDAAAGAHPDLADELGDLWDAVLVAEELAAATSDLAAAPPPGARDDRPPEGLVGGCEILGELGRGGMGVVYRARQVALDRIVALKRLMPGAVEPEQLRRFRFEGLAAAGLDHPNIVPVYALLEDDGVPIILMRCIEGTTLARRLADEGPMPPRSAAALLSPVCRAVAAAHARGILHRDLKPSNILLDAEGRPYVSDFGLAKRVDLASDLTRTGALVGSPSYMPPEQASAGRGPVGPPSDVHALGATLYHMITGRPPFQAASPLDTVLLVLEEDPIPPRALNPRADADLEMIALKCLQKRPGLRYPTAAALADDLDAFLGGEPVSARSASLRALAGRLLGETHHAGVLERWGLLWVLHSVAIVVFFGLATAMQWAGVAARWPYLLLFGVGLGGWSAAFWALRRRRGPVSFVERQMAHIWAAGMAGINLTLLVEWLLGLPAWALAPMLAVEGGMLFLAKAGLLSGAFYVFAGLEFLAVVPMAAFPAIALPLHALVSASGFLATGMKYHLRSLRARRAGGPGGPAS